MGGFASGSVVKNSPSNAGNPRDMGLILGSGRSARVGNGKPGTKEPSGLQSTEPQRVRRDLSTHAHML